MNRESQILYSLRQRLSTVDRRNPIHAYDRDEDTPAPIAPPGLAATEERTEVNSTIDAENAIQSDPSEEQECARTYFPTFCCSRLIGALLRVGVKWF